MFAAAQKCEALLAWKDFSLNLDITGFYTNFVSFYKNELLYFNFRRKTTLSTSQFFPVYSNCLYRHINIVSKTLLNILNIFYWTGENNNCRSDFCEAIWPFLVAGQLFGLLPVIRVKDRVASQLQFKWASLRTVYSLCILTILSFYTIFLIFETCVDSNTYATIGLWTNQIQFGRLSKLNLFLALLLFYVSNTCGIISLFILAKQWPALMDDWRAVEEILPSFKNQKQRKNFIFKIRMIALLIFFQATCIYFIRRGKRTNFLIHYDWFQLSTWWEHIQNFF